MAFSLHPHLNLSIHVDAFLHVELAVYARMICFRLFSPSQVHGSIVQLVLYNTL